MKVMLKLNNDLVEGLKIGIQVDDQPNRIGPIFANLRCLCL